MKDVILITKEKIIIHIVSLVAKKNDLDFLILDECNNECQKAKVIIIDEEDNFSNNLFDFTTNIILLTSKQISDISKYQTVIKKPFLPKVINSAILDSLTNVKKEPESEIKNLDEKADDLVEYLDNLDEDSEEVLIPKDSLNNGGVLDKEELNELSRLIDEDIKTITPKEKEEVDLQDLSKIIDNAIEELKLENKEFKNEYKMILNNFTFKELKPLLTKLDQEIIDKLVKGEEINLILKVENDK